MPPSSVRDIEVAAHEAWEKGQNERAFELFCQGASLGLVGCMLDLGYLYDEGIGIAQNKAIAMLWYKRAYRKGSSAAASNIAILYREKGRARLVFKWFLKSAQLGDGDSQVDVAKLYIEGKGTRRSLPLAREYLLNALSSSCITEAGWEEAAQLIRAVEENAL